MGKISKKEVEVELSKVIHPEINYNLLELGMIKNIEVKDNMILATLVLPFMGVPIKDNLIMLIKDSIKNLDKSVKIEIKTAEMNENEKEKFMKMAREGWVV